MAMENFGVQMFDKVEKITSPIKNVAQLKSYIEKKIANKEVSGLMMQYIVDQIVGWHNSLNFTSGMGLFEHGPDGVKQKLMKEFAHSPFTGEQLTHEEFEQGADEALSILDFVNEAAYGTEAGELRKLLSDKIVSK